LVDRPWGQLSYSGDHRKGPSVTGYYWPPGHETFTFRPLFTKIFTAQMGRGEIRWGAFTIPNRRLFRTLREKLIITTVTSNFVKHDPPVRAGQTHPHRPRLVVSHSTCPPLSSSPHAHSFVIGPAVIKHTPNGFRCSQQHGRATLASLSDRRSAMPAKRGIGPGCVPQEVGGLAGRLRAAARHTALVPADRCVSCQAHVC
jgi:hypothetical protein